MKRASALVAKTLEILTASLLFLMMATTVVDVIGRYFIGRSLPGAAEISALLLGLFVFGSIPLLNLRRGHITVDLLTFRPGSVPERVSRGLVVLFSAGCMAWIAIEVWQLAVDLARHGDTTAFLRIPYAPVAAFMALAAFIACLFALPGAGRDAGRRQPEPGVGEAADGGVASRARRGAAR